MDATVGDGEQAVVGERDTVRVAAEVGEDVLGPREGRLAVDDPGLAPEFRKPGVEGHGIGERRQAA